MGHRILIVDDSAVTRAVLKKTISMIDFPVEELIECSNGKDAMEVIRSRVVDLVLADLNMPEMTGIEMTRAILGNGDCLAEPAIVVITTERNDSRIAWLKSQGVRGYVHKPFTPEQIRDVLTEVLGVGVS